MTQPDLQQLAKAFLEALKASRIASASGSLDQHIVAQDKSLRAREDLDEALRIRTGATLMILLARMIARHGTEGLEG